MASLSIYGRAFLQKWKLVLPHVALVTVLSGYVLLGALVMFLIESPEERRIVQWHQEQMATVRKDFLRAICALFESLKEL